MTRSEQLIDMSPAVPIAPDQRDMFRFADEFGPAKILHIHGPTAGLRAIVVVDNVACGPAIGGVRMAPDVSVGECVRLARAMTMKNAAAGLPHGGGKSVIFGDPGMSVDAKEKLIRAFADAIRGLTEYIPGPDMGTNELCMAWIKDEIGRAIGLPSAVGGIPLDEVGATAFGLVASIDVARTYAGLDLNGARVVVQGFGSVGKHAARLLADRGATLVGVGEIDVTLVDPLGLDVAALISHKDMGLPFAEFPRGEKRRPDAVVDIECDIWIPAARPDVLRADNVGRLKTRLVAEGANIPCTREAEGELRRRGVVVVPDFVANAGGVICGAVEYRGGSRSSAFAYIDERIRANTKRILDDSVRRGVTPRAAAEALAEETLRAAMRTRRWR